MHEQDFITLSKKDCLVVYKEVLEKSKKKFQSAEILAKSGDFDSATSLLIVSNEISLIALILFLDGIGFNIRGIKGMKGLFKNHKLRYLFALVLSVFSIFTRELQDLLKRFHDNPNVFLNINPNSPEFAKSIKDYLLKRLLEVKEEISFFSKVDKSRQQGLYADYKGGLINISENEYLSFRKKIENLNNNILILIDSFTVEKYGKDSPFVKHLSDMQDNFNSKYPTNFEKLLYKINDPKFDSYESMTVMVDDLYKELTEKSDFEEFMQKDSSISKITEGIKKSNNKTIE